MRRVKSRPERNKEYAPLLSSIADKFYFSDTSTIVSADGEIEKIEIPADTNKTQFEKKISEKNEKENL